MCGPNSGLSPSGHLPRNRIDVLMLTAMNLAGACLKMGYPYIHCAVIIPIKEYSISNQNKIKLMLIVLETNISDKNRPFRAVIRRIRGTHLSCNLAELVSFTNIIVGERGNTITSSIRFQFPTNPYNPRPNRNMTCPHFISFPHAQQAPPKPSGSSPLSFPPWGRSPQSWSSAGNFGRSPIWPPDETHYR